MTYMISMTRDSAEHGGRNRFSCSSAAWDLFLELGMAFGWKPAGTTYVPASVRTASDNPALHGYLPGDQRDYKRIDADDALSWARSLSEARRSPHLATMIGSRPGQVDLPGGTSVEELRSANAPFLSVMDEFIEYAYGGEFAFARSL